MTDPDPVLAAVVTARPPDATTLAAWWDATAGVRARWPRTIDRALVGGAHADRLGFAFAGGYAAALRALVPGLDGIAALCATEDGGNHPRAIRTTLAPTGPGRYELTGHKKWATVGPLASTLLVVATTGAGADARPQLRVVRIAADAPGVRVVAATAPFIPEIPHAEIELARVAVTDAELLPGDGYADYLKPFRTVEDLHVHAALIGYLIGVAGRHALAPELIEQLLALAGATLALADPVAATPVTHLALAGALALVGRVVDDFERAWAAVPGPPQGGPSPCGSGVGGDANAGRSMQLGPEWDRWHRDRGVLRVAGAARAARRDRAWSTVAAR